MTKIRANADSVRLEVFVDVGPELRWFEWIPPSLLWIRRVEFSKPITVSGYANGADVVVDGLRGFKSMRLSSLTGEFSFGPAVQPPCSIAFCLSDTDYDDAAPITMVIEGMLLR